MKRSWKFQTGLTRKQQQTLEELDRGKHVYITKDGRIHTGQPRMDAYGITLTIKDETDG
jgi:hypothetical protein